ncbi:unnamed protein product [Porites lobata]|uniref:Uncharacterized protein n=1 Tax=Porites lobata TaxID=104759 RepID=A0ABN8NQF8_9CNID|nr:unnamed protein product [Porites lobata]
MAESTGHLLIPGDFNLHVDDPCSICANRFTEILESCNLKQHFIVTCVYKNRTSRRKRCTIGNCVLWILNPFVKIS